MRKPSIYFIDDRYGDAIGAVIVFSPRDECFDCWGSGQTHTCDECGGHGFFMGDDEKCSNCDGTGEVDYLNDCETCDGKGYIFDEDDMISIEEAHAYMRKVDLLRQRYGTDDLDELERRGIRDYFDPVPVGASA